MSTGRLRAEARAQAKAAWGRHRRAADLRARALPRLEVGPALEPPTAYYVVPESDRPQGGVRVAYRHVELLNQMGWRAAVVHRRAGHRETWFPHSAPVVCADDVDLRFNDVLVVPEWFGPSLGDLDPRTRVLVLNQGAYITFDALELDATSPGAPYAGLTRLEGIVTVSQDSAELLRMAFPAVPLDVARPVVDKRVFHPGPAPGGRSIACVGSRRPAELHLLRHLLRAVGVDWPVRVLEGLSEGEMAEALRSSSVFVSLSDRDGFGLPPAEAMACGAFVIGYPGGGGREFFDPAYCRPVQDTADLVRAVQDAVSTPPAELAAVGHRAAEAIHTRYHVEGLRSDLTTIFTRLLGRPPDPPSPLDRAAGHQIEDVT